MRLERILIVAGIFWLVVAAGFVLAARGCG